MANPDHIAVLQRGVEIWNQWRRDSHSVVPDLRDADLSGMDFVNANFYEADFRNACLRDTKLIQANLNSTDLRFADLDGACLNSAYLHKVDLTDAKITLRTDLNQVRANGIILDGHDFRGRSLNDAQLEGASFEGGDLRGTHLIGSLLTGANFTRCRMAGARLDRSNLNQATFVEADLSGADLRQATLIGTDFRAANISGAMIYGISAWDINTDPNTTQRDLIITPDPHSVITVDNIKLGQFIYLLLTNSEIREVIDTITAKAVLILGRFTPDRKPVLDAVRDAYRTKNFVPIMFDFEQPNSRDTIETIRIIAGMVKFVIADLTDAKSVLQELQAIVPNFPSLPVILSIKRGDSEPGMLDHIKRFRTVYPDLIEYDTPDELVVGIGKVSDQVTPL
jgi:uncharacterized protein YjbI with pentapeptide repeats